MIEGPSWAQLETAANTTPKKVIRELQLLPFKSAAYDEFARLVETAINFSITTMAAARNIVAGKGGKKRMDEDQLTLVLSLPLLGMAFDISHSTNVNGNCDIVVKGADEMLWLGEAKIYTDYGKLMGGFQQLCDRYSTGLPHQSRGGMIIYMFGEKVSTVMNEWRRYLLDVRKDLKSEDVAENPLQFETTEKHRATELPIRVRHMPVPLFHKPTDKMPPPARKRPVEKSRKAKA